MGKVINKALKLGVVGCGKMANAILGGVYKSNEFESKNIFVYDKNSENSLKFEHDYDFKKVDSIKELLSNSDIILLCVKPFVVDSVLDEISKYFNNQLVLSILAGVKIEKYESYLKNARIIRIMPNTPALVQEGMSAICPNKNCKCEDIEIAKEIMQFCSKVISTSEEKIDAITALSGSGPAYYYKIIELMAKSASKLGLDYKEALLLSSQTALGSAKMAIENNFDIAQLITNVTTPGGCTEVGNEILNNSNVDLIFDELIEKTAKKARELGNSKK